MYTRKPAKPGMNLLTVPGFINNAKNAGSFPGIPAAPAHSNREDFRSARNPLQYSYVSRRSNQNLPRIKELIEEIQKLTAELEQLQKTNPSSFETVANRIQENSRSNQIRRTRYEDEVFNLQRQVSLLKEKIDEEKSKMYVIDSKSQNENSATPKSDPARILASIVDGYSQRISFTESGTILVEKSPRSSFRDSNVVESEIKPALATESPEEEENTAKTMVVTNGTSLPAIKLSTPVKTVLVHDDSEDEKQKDSTNIVENTAPFTPEQRSTFQLLFCCTFSKKNAVNKIIVTDPQNVQTPINLGK